MRRTKVLQMDVQSDQVLSFSFSKMYLFSFKLHQTVQTFVILFSGGLYAKHIFNCIKCLRYGKQNK